MKWIRNISFRKKITLIFAVVCTFSTCIAGILYYRYAQKEIEDIFRENAESLADQLENTLDSRLEAVNRRAFAALTNSSFIQPLNDYLDSPSLAKEIALSSEAANWLKDISLAEPLVNSTLLYTEQGSWDDYTKSRNWEFDFENSKFAQYLSYPSSSAICWMPTMTDEIFADKDKVIPYVRRFEAGRDKKPAYLIIQIDQKVLLEEIIGDSKLVGEILITDDMGNYIAGTLNASSADLSQLSGMNEDQEEKKYSGDISYDGEEYLMYKGVADINNWQIFILKSKAEMFESVHGLRRLIVGLTIALAGACFIITAVLARQLTSSLQRLALQMNRMRNGEMDARYFYPYKDEVGSLAKTFNYMADKIENSMKKQEEYIRILKEERDFVEYVQKQKRKAELRALQAQINPHFLYNTLNTITWMAADKGMDEIRILSNSLGRFFRISLSKGAEVISIRDEIAHVRSYLTIQGIRYSEKMKYEIDIPEKLMECTVLKLVLQPLVENSIYHGIKEKEGMSLIRITAEEETGQMGEKLMRFVVEDTGMGIGREKLALINGNLKAGVTDRSEGYGIFNINERIRLYYGDAYGLYYESCEGEGTKAILIIPKRTGEDL
mgnify:CR=1 FL=1